jgi:hypothetical protein
MDMSNDFALALFWALAGLLAVSFLSFIVLCVSNCRRKRRKGTELKGKEAEQQYQSASIPLHLPTPPRRIYNDVGKFREAI